MTYHLNQEDQMMPLNKDVHYFSPGFIRRALQRQRFVLRHKGHVRRRHRIADYREYEVVHVDPIGLPAAAAFVWDNSRRRVFFDRKRVVPDFERMATLFAYVRAEPQESPRGYANTWFAASP